MVHISERELELPDAVIAKLLRIASEDKSVISLGPGEPDFDLPEPILKAVKNLKKDCGHYSAPGGRKELKEALIRKLKKENKINTDQNNIIVTCGSQEALMLASMCSLDVGEEIVLPDPGFMGYESAVDLISAVPVKLELREDENFSVNPDRLKKIIDKKRTKVILINSPSNPTGQVITKNILEEIADIAIENDLYVFSDEAYERLIYDKKHVSIGSLNGMEDYTVSFYTFSKSYAMCGFRVGYAVGPEEIINAMTKTHIYSTLCAPTPSQMVAVEALKIDDKHTQKMVDEYRKRRDFIHKRLNEIGLPTLKPDGAFYTFSNIKDYSKKSFKFAGALLKKAKVAVLPGAEFGRFGEGYIRCSYATDLELIKKAMDRIENFIKR